MPRDSAYFIRPEELLQAYRLGYFPMAEERDAPHAVWVLPDYRGVLQLQRATAPKKLRRLIKKQPFEIRINCAFNTVMEKCAEATQTRPETWINDQIYEVYCELHHLGAAHSVECYEDGALVGGLYGVAIGGVFCGESMFSRKTNASKVAMAYLIAVLKKQGFSILDTQFYTDHLGQFGVEEMSNDNYQRLLERHVDDPVAFDYGTSVDYRSAGPEVTGPSSFDVTVSVETVLQSITQTS